MRAVEVWFWYKALTVVEMLPYYAPGDIVDALLYQRFAIWVEILGFYAISYCGCRWYFHYGHVHRCGGGVRLLLA